MTTTALTVAATLPPVDRSLDIWVWVAAVVLLGVLGARAWTLETGQARPGRNPTKVRALTGASVGVAAVLVGLIAMQGGALLVYSIVTKTDPLGRSAVEAGPAPAPDPLAPVDPAAPPAAPAPPGG